MRRQVHLFMCLLTWSFLSFTCCNAVANLYPAKMEFQHVMENKDIVLGEVRVIHQDTDGFMWFGGWNALVRFDGYSFKSVDLQVEEKGKVKAVPLTHTIAILEDSSGTLWFSTSHGVARFDRELDRLTMIPDMPEHPIAMSKTFMGGMVELPSGEIFASSNSGAFFINPENGEYRVITGDSENLNNPDAPSHRTLRGVHIDTNGDVWFGTDLGLDRYDPKTGKFQYFLPDPSATESVANQVRVVESASDGKLWLGTGDGVILFDPKTKSIKRYRHDKNDPSSMGSSDVWGLTVDSKGRLWVSLDKGGLNLFVPSTDGFIRYMNKPSVSSSLSSDVVRTAFEDTSGDIWVGVYPDGIDFYDQSSSSITSYAKDVADARSLSHNSVLAVSEDKDGNFWVGTDGGGLNFFDRKSGLFTSFVSDPEDPSTISSNAVLSTFIDSNNVLWMGTWAGGASSYDITTKKFTRYPFNFPKDRLKYSDKLNSAHVWAIYEDSQKNIWFGTHTGGLNKYNRETKEFTHYWPDVTEQDKSAIASEWVWTMFEDSQGNFWVGTTLGLDLMDREKGTFQHFRSDPNDPKSLSEPYVLSIFEDSKKRLWIGTNAGLNLFDRDTKKFSHITKEDGLNDDSIRSILEDESGQLWLGTANGVSSFDPETKRIKNYNRAGGKLVGGFFYNAGVYSQKGEVVLGGINGLRFYKPKELVENPNIPPVVLTKLKIFTDEVEIGGEDGILSKSITHTDMITLDYTKSMFVLEFAAMNFRDPGKNQYQYMLEGFDNTWLKVDEQRSAKYTNLDAGKYVFKVKGSNNDGVWNEDARALTIIQMPPPWKTWWAYTIYAFAVFGIIAWAIQHQRNKRKLVEEQNRILEEKVAERTYELRQKNYDIQAMLSNMRQGLFTIESELKIHPEYSRYLKSIFNTDEIAGRDFSEFLFSNVKLSLDVVSQAEEAVKAIVGEDEYNFDFNSHLLVEEYEIIAGDDRKVLHLDWNPILVEDVVTKLMVTVRDVTRLKQMESEAESKKRELDIIGQLLNVSSKKFISFEKAMAKFIAENRETIKGSEKAESDGVALLFRNMHTIKGNCRTFGFNYISDIAHEVENTYNSLKDAIGSPINADELLSDIDRVESIVGEYSDIYHRVLGRGNEKSNGRGNGLWLGEEALQKIKNTIADVQAELGDSDIAEKLNPIESIISTATSNSLDDVLADIIASLPSIAEQLGKPKPVVNVNSDSVNLDSEAFDLMTNVFSHMLRNAIDHGIEPPDERVAAGKVAEGKIDIYTVTKGSNLEVHLRDDGRGLNIDRLLEIGMASGRWTSSESPDIQEVAQLIFNSGVSTKEEVSDISGRGVGMDAVKQFLLDSGGDIKINLLGEKQAGNPFITFESIVVLPSKFFRLTR